MYTLTKQQKYALEDEMQSYVQYTGMGIVAGLPWVWEFPGDFHVIG